MEVHWPMGEILSVPECAIVAPAVGTFRGLGDRQVYVGDIIERGDVIGTVESLGTATPVQSPFRGHLVGILALEGERVRPGQALAWLRAT